MGVKSTHHKPVTAVTQDLVPCSRVLSEKSVIAQLSGSSLIDHSWCKDRARPTPYSFVHSSSLPLTGRIWFITVFIRALPCRSNITGSTSTHPVSLRYCIWGSYNGVMNRFVYWDITYCSPLKINWRFGRTCLFRLQVSRVRQARNQQESGTKKNRGTWRLLKVWKLLWFCYCFVTSRE
jgi:hypothetical protein